MRLFVAFISSTNTVDNEPVLGLPWPQELMLESVGVEVMNSFEVWRSDQIDAVDGTE